MRIILLACMVAISCTAMNNNSQRSLHVDKRMCRNGIIGFQNYAQSHYNIPIGKKRTSQTRKSIEQATSTNELSKLVDDEFEQFEQEIRNNPSNKRDSLDVPDLHTIQENKQKAMNIYTAWEKYGKYANTEQHSGCCTIL